MFSPVARKILGLEKPDFNENDLRSAYRRAAHVYHPDKGGSSEQFLLLQRAHSHMRELLAMRKSLGKPVFIHHVDGRKTRIK